jgi:tryptophan 2-monooxygenase
VEPVARFKLFREIISRIHPIFGKQLIPANGEADILNVDWENTLHYYGAFKLQLPGQDPLIYIAYYQFLSVLDPKCIQENSAC